MTPETKAKVVEALHLGVQYVHAMMALQRKEGHDTNEATADASKVWAALEALEKEDAPPPLKREEQQP